MVAIQRRYENTWRDLTDEEVRHYTRQHRRTLALLDEEHTDPATLASTRAFLAQLVADGRAEALRRQRAGQLGVASEPSRFSEDFLAGLKSRVHLDGMIEAECGIALGRPSPKGSRRGPCPFCGGDGRSDRFVVATGDEEDQFYYCFSCQASGDAINLLMQVHGHPFPTAVEVLAAICGVPLPDAAPAPPSQRRYLDLARGAGADA
jgi:hypothetical protein